MNTATLSFLALALMAGSAQASVTLTFQEGVDGFTGTLDTMVRSASSGANTSYGSEIYVSVDGDDSSSSGNQPNHGLISFTNLFGNGAGQIKAGDTILSATLSVVVHNPGSGMSVYDMLTPWSESATWNSLGNGIQPNGVEAASTPIFTIGANNGSENVPKGVLNIDVTTSLQAMQAGSVLYGWAMLPMLNSGTNGIDFYTSEYSVLADRPMLSVEIAPVPEPETYALMLAGLGLVGFMARRKR